MSHRLLGAAGALALTLFLAGCGGDSSVEGTDPLPVSSSPAPSAGSTAPAVPTEEQWLADVHTAMTGSLGLVERRVAERAGGQRLAVNLDIDNTSVASHYEPGVAVPEVLELAREADRLGVAVLFNTGRSAADGGRDAARLVRDAGYPVTEICLRRVGEDLVAGKKRCRRHFEREGYTLIANVGNNPTDFRGSGYGRAYRLPNYDGALS